MWRLNGWWIGLLAAVAAVSSLQRTVAAEESVEVNVTGTLKTGIVAIGAETTGATITAKGITWELDFGKNAELKATAAKLSGKPVTVTGTLEKRPGVEVKERWIVTVKTLEDASGKQKTERDVGDFSPAIRSPTIKGDGEHAGTTITAVRDGDQTIIDIRCSRGIDRGVIERVEKTWPKKMVLRVHLKGLESFRISNGDRILECAVSSTGDPSASCLVYHEQRGEEVNVASPYFTEVKLVPEAKAAAKIPLNGYFEISLPAKLFESNPEKVSLQWIDFFR